MWLYWFGRFLVWLPLRIVYPTKFYGKRKIEKGKQMVISNHLSGWDVFLLGTRFSRPVCFMAKVQLYKNWFVRWIFNTLRCIPVNREETDLAAIKLTLKRLDDGNVFGIFPEGTRNRGDITQLNPLKNGAAMFAIKSQSPIYPCYIKYKIRPFKKNYLIKGEPFELSEFYGKKINTELLNEATKVIEQKLVAERERLDAILEEKAQKKNKKK